jgi:hypothetical protein
MFRAVTSVFRGTVPSGAVRCGAIIGPSVSATRPLVVRSPRAVVLR